MVRISSSSLPTQTFPTPPPAEFRHDHLTVFGCYMHVHRQYVPVKVPVRTTFRCSPHKLTLSAILFLFPFSAAAIYGVSLSCLKAFINNFCLGIPINTVVKQLPPIMRILHGKGLRLSSSSDIFHIPTGTLRFHPCSIKFCRRMNSLPVYGSWILVAIAKISSAAATLLSSPREKKITQTDHANPWLREGPKHFTPLPLLAAGIPNYFNYNHVWYRFPAHGCHPQIPASPLQINAAFCLLLPSRNTSAFPTPATSV